MRKLFFSVCLGLAACVASGQVKAGDFGTLTATFGGQAAGHSAGNGGRFDWTNVSTVGLPSDIQLKLVSGTLYSFCLEIQQTLGAGVSVFDINTLTNAPVPGGGSPMNATQAANLEVLTDNYFQTAATGTATQAGAFQLAVWDLVFGDGDYNVLTGAIPDSTTGISSATVKAAANVLLSNLPGAGGAWLDIPAIAALALVHETRQDQLIQVCVPEAASLLIWAGVAGVVGVAGRRRAAV